MRLLIDAGNTRLKWCLEVDGEAPRYGSGDSQREDPLHGVPVNVPVSRIAMSTVASEARRKALTAYLEQRFGVVPRCYWSESHRQGLVNAYAAPERMGADRWHGMYGAWCQGGGGFVLVDAGSAITVDMVDPAGAHLGGYILPGVGMMRRSLQSDSARVRFAEAPLASVEPGASTDECVHHGIAWLLAAAAERVAMDARRSGLTRILVTGGDAEALIRLGLAGQWQPHIVLDGLSAVDRESQA
ncbi:type III pantothenate kinase [Marinobacter sp. C2H3]|uniref:type III pantothenate kinase n=1 Tax=Marinobacter sp. C2H3 TaxID=3119003 RepID=UPI00300E7C0C